MKVGTILIAKEISLFCNKRPWIIKGKKYIVDGIDGQRGPYFKSEISNRHYSSKWERYFIEFTELNTNIKIL
jgi:hypothetical protein